MLTAIFLIGIAGMLSAQKIAIIDAGSSGSELYVYEWDSKELSVVYSGSGMDDTEGKILAQVDDTDAAAKAYLTKMTSGHPNRAKDPIPLYVLATAGMRGMDNSIYDKIVTKENRINGYKIIKAMTISGRYEGFYAWLAANYRNKIINVNVSGKKLVPQNPENPTHGILEIGGASMQIAFIKEGDNDIVNCIYREGLGNIYSKSYLDRGVNSVYKNYGINNNNPNPSTNNNANPNTPYDFGPLFRGEYDLSNVPIPQNLIFWGLGGSIRALFASGLSFIEYSSLNPIANDTTLYYHPHMNGEYINFVTNSLHLELNNTFKAPENPSNWTEGAALDILLYGETPEEYNGNN